MRSPIYYCRSIMTCKTKHIKLFQVFTANGNWLFIQSWAYWPVYRWIWGLFMFSVWGWFLLVLVILEMIKHVEHAVTDHKFGIGIALIFNTVFQYLPIFLSLLRYWVPLNVPLCQVFCQKILKILNLIQPKCKV